MRKEIENLYDEWYWSYILSSIITNDIVKNDYFWKLVEYCKEHKEEALKFIEEKLENGLSDIHMVIPYITIDENMIDEYFDTIAKHLSFEQMCNTWLNFLKNTEGVDYYIEYRRYQKYLYDNYIPWDPRVEDDPNITFQEFKKGLRNGDNLERSNESYFDNMYSKMYNEITKEYENN